MWKVPINQKPKSYVKTDYFSIIKLVKMINNLVWAEQQEWSPSILIRGRAVFFNSQDLFRREKTGLCSLPNIKQIKITLNMLVLN